MDRRHFIALATASTGSPGLVAARQPSGTAASPPDLSSPQGLMRALVKLRGSTDGRVALWWMKGPRYGVVGSQVTPLFQNLVASFHRFTRQPDGNFLVTVVELSYYTDLASGELLQRWRNPLTGAMNDVEYIVFGPVTARLTPSGIEPPAVTPGAQLSVTPTVAVSATHGDDIWIQEDVAATIEPSNRLRKTYRGNDLATYHGSLRALADPARPWVESTVHYQSVTHWRSWMKLDDIDGHLMARAVGRKVWSVEDLPREFLNLARRLNPQIIADPVAALQAPQPDASFQR